MYKTAKARLETMRLETQDAERLAASMPGAAQPLTPGISFARTDKPVAKAKTKAKDGLANKQDEKKRLACPRPVKGEECRFGAERCFYSHSPSTIDKAKAANSNARSPAQPTTKKKPVCRFFKKESCKKGDDCDFSHSTASDTELAGVALSLACVTIACPATENGAAIDNVPDEHLINNHMPPLKNHCSSYSIDTETKGLHRDAG